MPLGPMRITLPARSRAMRRTGAGLPTRRVLLGTVVPVLKLNARAGAPGLKRCQRRPSARAMVHPTISEDLFGAAGARQHRHGAAHQVAGRDPWASLNAFLDPVGIIHPQRAAVPSRSPLTPVRFSSGAAAHLS